ncbi:4,5-DOPA-extradiol-dioxygenase [Mariniflexile sp.]|uniref:4,5-DOPA-extradiol-dioxygenase n=2 Tax=Mariniflexile sp. TaxID=1979402 RepID=UPI0040485D6A
MLFKINSAMERQQFLKTMASLPLVGASMKLEAFEKISAHFSNTKKTPLLFIGHGHPINALLDNDFTQTLSKIGASIEKPNAIMIISAHWTTKGTFVSVNAQPKAIYDFGNIDDRLLQIKYEPKGHPQLARQAIETATNYHIEEDQAMGLDHGAWTVLKHLYPKADVPVFELSIDHSQPTNYHFQLANSLKKMRKKGVLIIASGNIVHNLKVIDWNNVNAKPLDWAIEFDEIVKSKLNSQDFKALVNYEQLGSIFQLAHPTNEHYLPMLYTLGLADKTEEVKYLFEGFQFGSASMRCFQIS